MKCPECQRDFPEEMLDERSKICEFCAKDILKTQGQEMIDAQEEKRKPICKGCKHEITEITQTQHENVNWKWNEEENCFDKQSGNDESVDEPQHVCHVKDCNCESEYCTNEFLDDVSGSSIGVDF